jgi:hypothetical protein
MNAKKNQEKITFSDQESDEERRDFQNTHLRIKVAAR